MDFFLTEQWSRSGCHSVKKVSTSPACLGVRALQSCQGWCHYSWVVRVGQILANIWIHVWLAYCQVPNLWLPVASNCLLPVINHSIIHGFKGIFLKNHCALLFTCSYHTFISPFTDKLNIMSGNPLTSPIDHCAYSIFWHWLLTVRLFTDHCPLINAHCIMLKDH